MTTLVTDGFEGEVPGTHSYNSAPRVMNLVYGSRGWTDAVCDESLEVLAEVGAIVLDRTVAGPGWETRLWRSREGAVPN